MLHSLHRGDKEDMLVGRLRVMAKVPMDRLMLLLSFARMVEVLLCALWMRRSRGECLQYEVRSDLLVVVALQP